MEPRLLPCFQGLYGITGPLADDADDARRRFTVRLAEALLDAGVGVLQLRDKFATGRELVETARVLRRLTSAAGALFIVNDRVDVALIAGADGVHLGQDDLPCAAARAVLGETGRRLLVGVSTHDEAEIRAAAAAGADYLGFGPIFVTATKTDTHAVQGLDRLTAAVRVAGALPVVAIGGIRLERAADVRRAGAAMGAIISEVACAPDPAARARDLHRLLRGG